jgi:hypothetical protein
MDNIELDDLVYTYPVYNENSVQTLISSKEEFRQVSAAISEPQPKRGQLYRHQKFIKRLMLQYDNQLISAAPGSGKGCAVISVTEHYKAIAGALEEIRKNVSDPLTIKTLLPPYKRAYVLVKGQNLIDEFKHQILCKCTDGDYITDQILNSKTETARKSNVTRSISRFYTITTYGTFAKTLFELTDEQLRIEFDNSIFIVDEVHNINDDKTGGILKQNAYGNSYYIKNKKDKKTGKYKEKIIESRLIYDQLWRLFHIVKPRKVMLLSATPMINDAAELGPRMNLILPENHQIPDNINWLTVTLDTLEPYFRGLISYVRALDTGAIPVYQGKVIQAEYSLNPNDPESEKVPAQFVVYGTEMADKQLKVYQQSVDDPLSLRPDSDRPEAFDDLKRQASNFVFPDNSTGSVGFENYVIEEKNDYKPTSEFTQWLSSPEHFRSLSAKFFEIVRLCKEKPGNCWCYLNYIKGAGAIVLGFCFGTNGFEKFQESSSVFSISGSGGLSSICGGKSLDDVDLKRERFIRIPKALRYALLTSDTSGPEAGTLLELFNSYENRHGEYIKVIIGSPVTRDGLNLANVLQIHLAGPGWNQASSYQAESRAIRSTSHVDLIEEERERLIKAGLDPNTAYINIAVYRHASLNREGKSVDIEMYELSEKKDREIKRIMRMMKQASTDCQINYNRNVRPKDINYSATCDYDICAYKCSDPIPNVIDFTSFDVLYSEDIVESAKSEIIDIFRVVFQITYESLYNELEGYRRKFIDLAVTDLVEKKIPIFNRYGYKSYVREDRGTLFLRNDFPLNLFEPKGAIALSEYSSYLIGKQTMTLNEYNGSLQRGSGNVLDILQGLDRDEIYEKIDTLTLENRIMLLETCIQDYYINKKETETNVIVLNKFRSYIFIEFEPTKSIEYVKKAISERGKGRGRKPKEGSKFKLTDKQEKELEDLLSKDSKKEVIYFHNLSTSSQAQTSYSITAKFKRSEGKIRLLKPSEDISWRDANDVEELVYNELIKNKTQKEKVEHNIYGLILGDEKFRIVDKTTEDTTQSKEDRRNHHRGRVCTTWNHLELVNLLWKLEYNPFNINIDFNREQFIIYLRGQEIPDLDKFSDEKLYFFYAWYTSGANKSKICELLENYFEDNGLLVMRN